MSGISGEEEEQPASRSAVFHWMTMLEKCSWAIDETEKSDFLRQLT